MASVSPLPMADRTTSQSATVTKAGIVPGDCNPESSQQRLAQEIPVHVQASSNQIAFRIPLTATLAAVLRIPKAGPAQRNQPVRCALHSGDLVGSSYMALHKPRGFRSGAAVQPSVTLITRALRLVCLPHIPLSPSDWRGKSGVRLRGQCFHHPFRMTTCLRARCAYVRWPGPACVAPSFSI
jgi:hypothetical protein